MRLPKPRQAWTPPPSAPAGYETVVPNPKLKLLDQMREVMRLKPYSIRTERSRCCTRSWERSILCEQPGLPECRPC